MDAAATNSVGSGIRHCWSVCDGAASTEQAETTSIVADTNATDARRNRIRFTRRHIGPSIYPASIPATAEIVPSR